MTTNKSLIGALGFSILPRKEAYRCYSINCLHSVRNLLLPVYKPRMVALKLVIWRNNTSHVPPLLFIHGNKKWVRVPWGDKAKFSSIWVQSENISEEPLDKEVASQGHESWKWGNEWFCLSLSLLLCSEEPDFVLYISVTMSHKLHYDNEKGLETAKSQESSFYCRYCCYKICFALMPLWHEDTTFEIW